VNLRASLLTNQNFLKSVFGKIRHIKDRIMHKMTLKKSEMTRKGVLNASINAERLFALFKLELNKRLKLKYLLGDYVYMSRTQSRQKVDLTDYHYIALQEGLSKLRLVAPVHDLVQKQNIPLPAQMANRNERPKPIKKDIVKPVTKVYEGTSDSEEREEVRMIKEIEKEMGVEEIHNSLLTAHVRYFPRRLKKGLPVVSH
jgi:hypothetical protein